MESRANGSALPLSDRLGEYRPYLQEEIDTAGMTNDCIKLERLFQEVADQPEEELLTYVDRWGCIPNASTKTSNRHLNDAGVELLGHIPSESPNPFCWRLRDRSKRPWAAEPLPAAPRTPV